MSGTGHRVLAAMFGQETNVQSRLPATLDSFRQNILVEGEAVLPTLGRTATEFAGLAAVAAERGWRLTTPLAAWATPGGRVTRDAWETLSGRILDGCRAALAGEGLDGVLLFLHGAMATEQFDDAEGELLAALRAVVPAGVPIAVTLDLHANVTPAMCRHADILCAFRTYPHIDQAATAERAGRLLAAAMDGRIAPRLLLAPSGLPRGLDDGRTTVPDGPMLQALALADASEAEDSGVLCASLQAGFWYAALAEAGPSVVVTWDAKRGAAAQAAAEAAAGRLTAHIRATRQVQSYRLLTSAQAVAQLRHRPRPAGAGPVVLADYSDNPGAGAYGDSPLLLAALLAADLGPGALGTLYDPEAVRQLADRQPGDRVELEIGGRIDPAYGAPLPVRGELVRRTDGRFVAQGPRWRGVAVDLGDTVVLRVGRMEILIVSNRMQVTELETFTHAGIDPAALDFVVVKSMQHFRAAFAPLASDILLVDAGALCSERGA